MQIAHLAFHYLLLDDKLPQPNDDYYYFPLKVEPAQQVWLASRIELMTQTNIGRIPYSVEHDGITFSQDGLWAGDKPGAGLTCATFITEVLRHWGYEVLRTRTWPKRRRGDKKAKRNLLRLLRGQLEKANSSTEHVNAQSKRLGKTVRIRPNEASVGVGIFQAEPLDFRHVDGPARYVETCL